MLPTDAMATCKLCDEQLVLRIEDSDTEDSGWGVTEVPDDVEFRCRCHYHWQCIMDEATSIVSTLQCPACHNELSDRYVGQQSRAQSSSAPPDAEILVRYTNEGGIQEALDIMPSVKEEAYLLIHPEAAPARAFQVMCAEGDIDGAFELLYHAGEQIPDAGGMVRYQDPLSNMKSGLHLAVENQHEGVVWLLLWLSSHVSLEDFPEDARQAAESIGLRRLEIGPEEDVRALKDDQGNIAASMTGELSGPWLRLVETGILQP